MVGDRASGHGHHSPVSIGCCELDSESGTKIGHDGKGPMLSFDRFGNGAMATGRQPLPGHALWRTENGQKNGDKFRVRGSCLDVVFRIQSRWLSKPTPKKKENPQQKRTSKGCGFIGTRGSSEKIEKMAEWKF